jgi:hypothetical protein
MSLSYQANPQLLSSPRTILWNKIKVYAKLGKIAFHLAFGSMGREKT